MLRLSRAVVRIAFVALIIGAVAIGSAVGLAITYFGRDLPDYQQLADYRPAVGSKVFAGDGAQIAQFESEHRIPVPIAKVPRPLIQAILAAEDRDFYNHQGVDPAAILRAALADILRLQRGQRPLGASTITQQVVRHFLLTNELSLARKIKEAILAYRIEHAISKDRILEIYLNEIYLGAGAYGVAAAADAYFQKPLDQLSLAETALIAALPKAPSNYNPLRHPAAAKARRDWVLTGMVETGAITQSQARVAMAEPLGVRPRPVAFAEASGANGYFAEEVRRELVGRFGEKTVYEGGLTVRTSYSAAYQRMAEAAFRHGLVEYDRRHGWRGALAHYGSAAAAQAALAGLADPPGIGDWQPAAVTGLDAGGAQIALKNGTVGRIPLDALRWARRTVADQRLGPAVRRASDVLTVGDIVLVEALAPAPASGKSHRASVPAARQYALRQIPDVGGGVVLMDPKTGRVFAIVGGWSFQQSQFNRVTQAKRQPGSAFKPFVYVTALQNGFTPWSVVEDAPLALPQGPGLPPWQPVNYEGGYVGPTTLEDALIHSRNLVTARLATMIGLPAIAKTAEAFDIMDRMPLYYSMSLGAGETTLLRLTNAYAMLDNGGHWLVPSVIDVVQDRNGKILYQKGIKGCPACFLAAGASAGGDSGTRFRAAGPADPAVAAVPDAGFAEHARLYKPTKPDPLINPDADGEIIDMMQGVVQRGTGSAVAAVGKPLAGKTGTTSDWQDAWFVGFSPDLAAGVYVGFDEPRTLGDGETGGRVAAPIFRDLMAAALQDKPAKPFPPPSGAALLAGASPRAPGVDVAGASPGRNAGLAGPPGALAEAEPDADAGMAAETEMETATDREIDANAGSRRRGPAPASPAAPNAYPSPQWPNFAAAQAPAYASPWGLADGGTRYPGGGYPAPIWPGYGAYPMVRPAPGYSLPGSPYGYYGPAPAAPRTGTGGLY
jgi:penicillin-binding protein 1A